MDSRISQTLGASPAAPGGLPISLVGFSTIRDQESITHLIIDTDLQGSGLGCAFKFETSCCHRKIAKVQKSMYSVERTAFLITGGDIAHIHTHVLPMFEKTDITSLHYIKDKNVIFEEPPKDYLDHLKSITEKLKSALEKF